MTRATRIDMEEVAPDRFVLHNSQLGGFLKGEGVISGRLFTLTTTRRDGLIARLRSRSFQVTTLDDLIQALPPLPPAATLGAFSRHPLPDHERWSRFDAATLRWQPLHTVPDQAPPELELRSGWVIRRRKRRGPPSFLIWRGAQGGRIIDETEALLQGYAQPGRLGSLAAERDAALWCIPAVELPPSHRALLQRILTRISPPAVDERAWPLAQAIFARLDVALTLQ